MGNVMMEADQIRYKGQYRTVQEALDNGGGGGGTTVVANPEAAATADLEKLQVGVSVYGVPATAAKIAYDNTSSGLTADDVQDAIDELNAGIGGINELIPSDATSSNKLATAGDIPGVATTSAPGIVQPDGTTITIADGVISAVGGAGNVNFAELPAVDLSELLWTQGTSGVYYAPITNVFPAGKKLISAVAYAYSGLSPSNYAIMFAQSESNPANLVLTSGTNQYTGAAISIRVCYV